jgi:hypothetical protein
VSSTFNLRTKCIAAELSIMKKAASAQNSAETLTQVAGGNNGFSN